jgi:hypothetical protein
MKAKRFSITREPDDKLADVRISLGEKAGLGAYIVFRGEPEAVAELLRQAATLAAVALPRGDYEDQRGRGQG